LCQLQIVDAVVHIEVAQKIARKFSGFEVFVTSLAVQVAGDVYAHSTIGFTALFH
jgi:hypothetical protein